jgi:PIN domain nuclease of toxin-antitoxin system
MSLWKFAMMATRGRITVRIDWKRWVGKAVSMSGLKVIEITPKIATESCSLPGEFHEDPADRIIVATARIYNSTLSTKDKKMLKYQHVNAVW